MKKLLMLAAPFIAFAAPVQAQTVSEPRNISVSGSAKEEINPDQAVLSLSVVSRDKVLANAKKHNDDQAKKVVGITDGFKIPQEKISTSSLNISPEYNYNDGKQTFIGYVVNRSLRITIDKLDIQEKLISALVDAKIDQINGLEFQLADPKAHESRLRIKAFQDAKVKADELAKAADSKLGKALSITTEDTPAYHPPRPMMAMAKSSADMAESVAPTLPGLITLQQNVNVTFALE